MSKAPLAPVQSSPSPANVDGVVDLEHVQLQ